MNKVITILSINLLILLGACASTYSSYVVRKGDNLLFIAQEHNVSLREISNINGISDPNKIRVGQILKIPGAPFEEVVLSSEGFHSPAKGKISSRYGMRRGRMHYGIDIANKVGTPIYAPNDGFVVQSKWMRGYGRTLKIKSNNVEYIFAHLSSSDVKKGSIVKKGQVIGKMGATGNATGSHLHFEVRVNGEPINPVAYVESPDIKVASKKRLIGIKR